MASCSSCSSQSSCSSASESGSCTSGEPTQQSFASMRADQHELSEIRSIIGVASGKGGVGKSMVTTLLAANLARKGYRVGILDADITGPSIPKAFGLEDRLEGFDGGIFPSKTTKFGVRIVSINLMLDDPEAPVLWRGPILSGLVKQFYTDVVWDQMDVLILDMPPGTGDVPLTIYQSIPLDGLIVVSTPQDLVSLIVKKARTMATMMEVPLLGFIENMSYFKCPSCDQEHQVFGPGKTADAAAAMNVPLLDRVPLDPKITEYVDAGTIEEFENDYLTGAIDAVEALLTTKPPLTMNHHKH
ncbi:MAG: Mrp/NBP35 family ATP-binding protein [Eubacteriales bacterium]|nr:Mrp/NBP35 family ATP-binding protein [Eubacteriales bacterium]